MAIEHPNSFHLVSKRILVRHLDKVSNATSEGEYRESLANAVADMRHLALTGSWVKAEGKTRWRSDAKLLFPKTPVRDTDRIIVDQVLQKIPIDILPFNKNKGKFSPRLPQHDEHLREVIWASWLRHVKL